MNNFKKVADAMKAGAQKVSSSGVGGGGLPEGGGRSGAIGGLLVAGSLLGLVGYGAYKSMINVNPGHRGIVYNRFGVNGGGLDESVVFREGLNFVIPWFQRPIIYDIRTRPKIINSTSGSKDLQMVEISLRVLFKPDANKLPDMYRLLGKDYDERVLPSIVNEVTKAVIAQYNASELLTKRNVVSNQIRLSLMKRSEDFHILLEDVSITHLAFSKEYTAAVEAKQVAQQDSERAKFIVDRALQEKRSIVIKAQGEAQSAILIGNAIRENPAFVQLRRIEAAKEIASTLARSTGNVYLNADNLLLNHLGEAAFNTAQGTNATNAPTTAKSGWY